MMIKHAAIAVGLALAASATFAADKSPFSKFTPLVGRIVAGSLPEAYPLKLASPLFSQVIIVARDPSQATRFDTANDDMHTANETGPNAGRCLFTVFETGQAGIQRIDLTTMETTTLRQSPAAAPADIVFKHRNILPRVSHEGLVFDKKNNLYFIDERNGGAISKYTSRKPNARNGDDFFTEGQSFVLRVGDGSATDANGVTSLDGRATVNLPAFLGSNYDRPEDMEIKRGGRHGREMIFVATTTTTTNNNKVFTMDQETDTVKLFASRATLDKATGVAVGTAFTSPDNLAIDADGNIYIVEDRPGGLQDTWFAFDEDDDGVAESVGEWATLSTADAEGTGLYFDKFRPNTAYINVQHPSSGVDRTIMITGPCVCPKDD